jgi:hypothetical protein
VQREAALLQHDAGALAELLRVRRRVEAEDPHPPCRGGTEPLQDLEGGRLAGAVGSEEAEDLASIDGERDVLEHRPVAVAPVEPVHLDHRVTSGDGHVSKIRLGI